MGSRVDPIRVLTPYSADGAARFLLVGAVTVTAFLSIAGDLMELPRLNLNY